MSIKSKNINRKKDNPSLEEKDSLVNINKKRKQIKPDKKKSDRIIDIYKQDSGEKIDMTKLDKKFGKNKGKYIFFGILALFILAAAALSGFYVFNNDYDSSKKEAHVDLVINSVNEIASGELIEIEITYENKEDSAIKEGNIIVHYPNGFYFQKANPQPNTSDNTWNIANIAPGAGGKITITGQIVGELEENKTFTSFLTYKPENFNSDFQETVSKIVKINDSIVTLETELPQIAFSGQEVEYTVKFNNSSSLPLPNAKVVIEYPEGFEVKTAEPTADINNDNWTYDELASNQEQIIKISGRITGESKQQKEFKFKLGLEEPNGLFNLQVEKTNMIMIVNPDLELSIEGPEYINPEQDVEYKITVENVSDIDIENLKLQLNFSEEITEEKTVQLEDIELLEDGSKKEIIYKTKIIKKIPKQVASLTAKVVVASANIEEKNFEFDDEAQIESLIKAQLEAFSQARYYADDLTKLGSGPVPPQVGETTSYVINWQATAKGGDLENIEIITSLANYADGVESGKNITYSQETGQVKWKIDQLEKGETQEESFTVFITPTKDQLNKLLILTKETIINALDSNTQENISVELEQLTSDLPDDPAASGQGVVIKSK